MASRFNTHVIESESKQLFSSAITKFHNNSVDKGDLLFRDVIERDYGIDGLVELFSHGEITGRIAMIQLKGTEKPIKKLKTFDMVACPKISKSNLSYCRQRNNPVILVYCSTADNKFYYIDLQSVYKNKIPEIGDNDVGTIRIPIENSSDDLGRLVNIINSYYSESVASLKIQTNRVDDSEEEFDPFTLVESYTFTHGRKPSDGEHKEIGENGDIISVGLWQDGRLIHGTEYDWLICVSKGQLIFKPDDPEDPYDSTDDFEYEKLEQWGWRITSPFTLSMPYLENDETDKFFVVNMEVDGDYEQMVNIRPVKGFLKEMDPELFRQLSDYGNEQLC